MKPKYCIVNTCDAPCDYHVAELVNGKYYYMARSTKRWKHLKQFDGMNPERPTDIQEFGFAIHEGEGLVTFSKVVESTATYEDGKPRRWQGDSTVFSHRKVVVRPRKKAA